MKTKSLQLGVLFFLTLVASIFFFSPPAKATGYITLDGTGYTYKKTADDGAGNFTFSNTIGSSCRNSFLMAFVMTWQDSYAWNNVSYDGATMTDSGLGLLTWLNGSTHIRWQTFKLVNPSAGTKVFHIHNTRGANSDPMTIILKTFCNVDQINPLDRVGDVQATGSGQYSTGYFNITNDHSLVLANYILQKAPTGAPTGTSGYATTSAINTYDADSYVQNFNFFSNTVDHKTANDYYFFFASSTPSMARGIDSFTLNYSQPVYCGDGACTGSETQITCPQDCSGTCGDGLCNTLYENCGSCSADCGQCATNPNAGDTSLFFFSNPYTFSNQTTAKVRYIYNQDIFTPYDYIEVRQISADWATSTFIATSSIIDSTGFFTDKTSGNSYFTLTGNGSTTGIVDYDVIGHLASYWSPTLGTVAATTTIPYVVAVNWQSTQIPTAADILAASSSNPFYDDTAMYNAACTAEQWATPDPQMWLSGTPMPALNFTVMGCKFKLGLIIAGNKFTTIVTDSLYNAGNILKNVFPFNVYTNLNSAWTASANAAVLPELAFLTPVNGDLTVQIPTIGTSTASLIVWGKDIFTSSSTLGVDNANKVSQMFLAIKTIIKWALWGLFGLWAIKNGKAFVEKLTQGE